MRDLSKLLAESFSTWDIPSPEATARATIALLVAVGAIPHAALEQWERDAQIYHLKGHNVTAADIGLRFAISRQEVYRALNRHMRWRRNGIRQRSRQP